MGSLPFLFGSGNVLPRPFPVSPYYSAAGASGAASSAAVSAAAASAASRAAASAAAFFSAIAAARSSLILASAARRALLGRLGVGGQLVGLGFDLGRLLASIHLLKRASASVSVNAPLATPPSRCFLYITPLYERIARQVSVGCAPFCNQSRAFPKSRSIVAGFVLGL